MTSSAEPIVLRGLPGSPYTRKMVAVLRYRRLAYRYLLFGRSDGADLPRPKVELLPTVYLPGADGALEAVVDTSPIIRRLEGLAPARAVIPPDPVVRFLDELIEDYADEWLTKPMFHYRWVYEADAAKAAAILPRWRDMQGSDEAVEEAGRAFAERQIGRLGVVGSNDVTGPIIEASYSRFLAILDQRLAEHSFLMGERPGSCDFGVFGQLSQLAQFDPTPARMTLEWAPRVYAWVWLVEDLSGLDAADDGWIGRDALGQLRPLFGEIGRTYAPVMLANARALAEGAGEVEAEVDGQRWVQAPFPYQVKCLQWLKASFAGLSADDQVLVREVLDGSGCDRLLD